MEKDVMTATKQPARRLCSEIQLFDLCDLDACSHRQERFCTNSELLSKFEQIAEEDISSPTKQFLAEELEESEDDDELLAYGDGLADNDYDDENGWED